MIDPMLVAAFAAGAGTLVAGALVGSRMPRLRRMRAQLVLFGLAVSLLPIGAVVASGLVMLTPHDALALGVVAASSGAAATGLAFALAARISRDVARLSDGATTLAGGDLTVQIEPGGSQELRDLADSFNEMASALRRQFETRRNVVAWASHDLRTPLAALQAMVEALQDDLGDPRRYLEQMRSQVRTLSVLVDDLFELSRIETGALVLEPVMVALDELADGCVTSLRAHAESRGIDLRMSSTGRVRAVCAPDKVERVLMNLLANALRHTPSDGSVAVTVRGDARAVTVAVEDDGEGLPDGATERVFESFWRADRARALPGAGLGLAIARGLVEAHGGRIWAENRSEGGARFTFTLPAA